VFSMTFSGIVARIILKAKGSRYNTNVINLRTPKYVLTF